MKLFWTLPLAGDFALGACLVVLLVLYLLSFKSLFPCASMYGATPLLMSVALLVLPAAASPMGLGGRFGVWLSSLPRPTTIAAIIFGGTCLGAAYYLYINLDSGRRRGRAYGAVPPMVNLGNTCYANALLQALASSPAFASWLESIDPEVEANEPSMKLLHALKLTIKQLNSPDTECCSAADVIAALLEHRWTVPPNVEQDLYELFDVFVTTWDEELAKLKVELGISVVSDLEGVSSRSVDRHIAVSSIDGPSEEYGDGSASKGVARAHTGSSPVHEATDVSWAISVGSADTEAWSPRVNDGGPSTSASESVAMQCIETNEVKPRGLNRRRNSNSNRLIYGDDERQSNGHADATEAAVGPACSAEVRNLWRDNDDVNISTLSRFSDYRTSDDEDRDIGEGLLTHHSGTLAGPGTAKELRNGSAQLSGITSAQILHSKRFFEIIKKSVAVDERLRLPCSGLLVTELRCCSYRCAYKKLRQDRFCALSLSLPKTEEQGLSLERMLYAYFSPEIISDAKCDKCGAKSSLRSGIRRTPGLCRLPSMLVLRVERVGCWPSGYVFKRSLHFSFPELLDIRNFCYFAQKGESGGVNSDSGGRISFSSSAGLNTTCLSTLSDSFAAHWLSLRFKYRLRAVSVHIGQPHSGHFITYRRGIGENNQNAWYKTSDSEVTRVPFSEVTACEAYMLYYDRCLSSSNVR